MGGVGIIPIPPMGCYETKKVSLAMLKFNVY